ncbi:MAG TPA: haloacid dehalogenase-like hydrolase [Acidobacteriaceae bacterium]
MKRSKEKKLRTAIIYDFDGTLAKGNLQENSFIPDLGMKSEAFWKEVKETKKKEDADEILVYMHLMLTKARAMGTKVRKSELQRHGENASLFPGLSDGSWFKRMNEHAGGLGLKLEHFIISSGVEEMIKGCRISKHFERIFASKFIYSNGLAAWPGVAINYTTKTQYLFRINKGVDNHWDNEAINAYKAQSDRPVPFERMIFLGDGDTDIPTMKMLTYQGGHSIAVYDSARTDRDLGKIHRLISDDRVDFVAPADYQADSPLDIIVKGILGRIRHLR